MAFPTAACGCVREKRRPPPWKTPSSFHFRSYCIKFHVAVLLVLRCQFSPVSVFARPERLGVQELQRARGHHSRFVQEICFLPALHGALIGIDAGACGHAVSSMAHHPEPVGASVDAGY